MFEYHNGSWCQIWCRNLSVTAVTNDIIGLEISNAVFMLQILCLLCLKHIDVLPKISAYFKYLH